MKHGRKIEAIVAFALLALLIVILAICMDITIRNAQEWQDVKPTPKTTLLTAPSVDGYDLILTTYLGNVHQTVRYHGLMGYTVIEDRGWIN